MGEKKKLSELRGIVSCSFLRTVRASKLYWSFVARKATTVGENGRRKKKKTARARNKFDVFVSLRFFVIFFRLGPKHGTIDKVTVFTVSVDGDLKFGPRWFLRTLYVHTHIRAIVYCLQRIYRNGSSRPTPPTENPVEDKTRRYYKMRSAQYVFGCDRVDNIKPLRGDIILI